MLSQRFQQLIAELGHGLHEKEELIRLTLLAAVAGQNVFLYGPPGVAKSMLARRIAKAFRDSRNFEYLLGRFTTPEEIFGPVSISRLKDADRFERVVEGFLPDAHIVFLDEIWNASSPILNTLLTAINEHRFRNGSDEVTIPLRSVIAASRSLAPDEAALENLWDRFLLRLPVQPVTSREAFGNLLSDTREEYMDPVTPDVKISMDELDEWQDAITMVDIPGDIEALVYDIRERISRHNSMIRQEETLPIVVSDRRWKQAARLLRASAYLNGRNAVDAVDCLLLRHCLWSREEDQETVQTIVAEATRRYLSSGIFDPQVLREELQKLLAVTGESRGGTRTDRIDRPVPYRGEYYRVTDFVDDHLSLIWIGDFQNLRDDETVETDLFFYGDEDEYAYSERFHIRRAGPRSIEIDGVTFDLEHETVTQTVRDHSTLSDDEKADLRTRLSEYLQRVNETEERVLQYRDSSTGEALEHLFVHRSYAEVVIQGMDAIAAELALIKADVSDAVAELS
jgi:MoxR-like ATPase